MVSLTYFAVIIRFHSRPIKDYFEKVPSAKEEHDKPLSGWYKRDSIVQADNETGMFHSEIQNFPGKEVKTIQKSS